MGGEEVKTTSIMLRTCKNEARLGQEIQTHEWLKRIYAVSVCGIFVCPNNGMASSVWDFLTCTDVDACDCTRELYGHHKNLDDGPLSSFQGRSSSASSFNASLLQVIDGVMSLALRPQVVSQAPQHFRSSEKQAIVRVALPSNLSARSIPFTPACPGQYTHFVYVTVNRVKSTPSAEHDPPPIHSPQ